MSKPSIVKAVPSRPFDLGAALAGAPVRLRGGRKAFVLARAPDCVSPHTQEKLIGYAETCDGRWGGISWFEDGQFAASELSIVGMWDGPKHKLIHGVQVPDISFAPKDDEPFYHPSIRSDSFVSMAYFHAEAHQKLLNHNLCYPYTDEGKAAAILHAKAIAEDLR